VDEFAFWTSHHLCPRCGSEDLSDLDFDVMECVRCGKQFKPSVELMRMKNGIWR